MNLDNYMFESDEDLLEKEKNNPIEPIEPIIVDEIITGNPIDGIVDDTDDSPEVDHDALAYFEYLKETGVLDVPEDFKFGGDTASINNALAITKDNMSSKIALQIWNALPEDFKPLLQYGLNGGKNLNDYLSAYKPLDYTTADIDDETVQRLVIKQYYKELKPNFDEARVDRMVEKLESMGGLKEEAEDAIDYLNTLKKEKQQSFLTNLQQEQENAKIAAKGESDRIAALIEAESSYDSLRKNRLKNFLLNPIQKDNQVLTEFDHNLDSVLSNPQHLLQLADLLADYHPKVGFNFDRMKRQLKTESAKGFKQLINEKLDTKSGIKGGSHKGTQEFDLEKFLKNS